MLYTIKINMKKAGTDPKVKKTLVRNCEEKIRKERERVIHDVDASSSKPSMCSNSKENDLDHPSLCSSQVFAKYLGDTKRSLPLLQAENFNVDKGELTAKITKKLNFHFNDRIYKNLVELNADTESLKTKSDKRAPKPSSAKKDLEPKIEDFCDSDDDVDLIPSIPMMRPKFKLIRQVENGHLHGLVASFEDL